MGLFSRSQKDSKVTTWEEVNTERNAARDEWMMHDFIGFPLNIRLPEDYFPKTSDVAGTCRKLEHNSVMPLILEEPAKLTWVRLEDLSLGMEEGLLELISSCYLKEPEPATELEETEEPTTDETSVKKPDLLNLDIFDTEVMTTPEPAEPNYRAELWKVLEKCDLVDDFANTLTESYYGRQGCDNFTTNSLYVGRIEVQLDQQDFYRTGMVPGWECDFDRHHCISEYLPMLDQMVWFGERSVPVMGMFMDYEPYDRMEDLPNCKTLWIYTVPIRPVVSEPLQQISCINLYCEDCGSAMDLDDLRLSVFWSNCVIYEQRWTNPYDIRRRDAGGYLTETPEMVYRHEMSDPDFYYNLSKEMGLIRTVTLAPHSGYAFSGDPRKIEVKLNGKPLHIDQWMRYYPEAENMCQATAEFVDGVSACAVWLVPSHFDDGEYWLKIRFAQRMEWGQD